MRNIPVPYSRYRHFKGNDYQVIAVAKDAGEDGKRYVIYQALYGDYAIYARELNEFLSPVDKVKYPDAAQEYRFEEIGNAPAKAEPAYAGTVQSAVVSAGVAEPVIQPEEEAEPLVAEGILDPEVVRFLDAKEPEDKLTILTGLHSRITDDMLTVMAVASDFELNEGSVEEKYLELKNALVMRQQFEKSRLR